MTASEAMGRAGSGAIGSLAGWLPPARRGRTVSRSARRAAFGRSEAEHLDAGRRAGHLPVLDGARGCAALDDTAMGLRHVEGCCRGGVSAGAGAVPRTDVESRRKP